MLLDTIAASGLDHHATAYTAPEAPSRQALVRGLDFPGAKLSFGRNEEIFGEGEPADFVYKVVSGAVRSFKILSDGRRHIDAFYMPGDVFGLEMGKSHRFSAEAIADTEVVLIRRSAIEAAAKRDSEAARELWTLTSQQLEHTQDHMLLLGRKNAMERVAAFLLWMAGRNRSRDTVDLPMSRNDIADYLGLTIETVSRTLTQLERDRTIALPSSRHIVLRNRAVLADLEA